MPTIEWTNRASVMSGLDRYPEIFREEFTHALELSAELIIGATVTGTPVSDGILAGSIHHMGAYPIAEGYAIGIGDNVEYGEVIEYGRRPGSRMPPSEALLPWVWAHRQYFSDVETEEDAKGIAFVVARKIATSGFSSAPDGPGKGWGMYEKAMAAQGPATEAIFRKARDRIEARCEQVI